MTSPRRFRFGFQKEKTNLRTIGINYNTRAHTIQYSKRRAKENSDKEKHLQNEYTHVSKLYAQSEANANILHAAKKMLELFYEEQTKLRNNYSCTGSLVRTWPEEHKVFSQLGEEKSHKEAHAKIDY